MAIRNRRSNKSKVTQTEWDNPNSAVRREHDRLIKEIKKDKTPLEKKATLLLVSQGYNLVEERRFPFDIRKNKTGTLELVVPRSKLELVSATHVSLVKVKKGEKEVTRVFFFVSKIGDSEERIVPDKYSVVPSATELVIPIYPKKKKA
jgi:hypothetical protein